MGQIGSAIRVFVFLFIITGFVYPTAVTLVAQFAFPEAANGSLVRANGQIVGSKLLAQKFSDGRYFHPRPSAVDYNTLSSGGSNLSPIAEKLRVQANSQPASLPRDLVFASGSGLDPHITPEAARSQVARIAQARKIAPEKVLALLRTAEEPRQFGFLGEPRVNVLVLNLKLDQALLE